jgi:hypothetical protein
VPTGIAILDNNCLDVLADPESLRRFRGNLRAADWHVQLSEVNLLESVATSNAARQRHLVDTIREVAGGTFLLRWPFSILKELGEAIAAGKPNLIVEPMDAAAYLHGREESLKATSEVADFNRKVETAFNKLHERNRPHLRRRMRERGITDTFGSARAFLEDAWHEMDMRTVFAEVTWSHFRLPGKPPMEALELCEPWRILLDTEGVAVYERAVASNLPRRVQRMDLIQLVYLGLGERRMIITGDKGLLRAAEAIFPGRYKNARAVDIADLIS